MREKLVEMLAEINPFIDVDETTDLIDEEVLDSLGIMALIDDIESVFQVKIDMSTIEIDNFRTLESIVKLIGKENNG